MCNSKSRELIHIGDESLGKREFYNCDVCDLVYVPDKYYLTPNEEKKRYNLHNNDPYDVRYRKFLNKLINEIKPYISKDMCGLDYGCGPGPALSIMLKEKGYKVQTYDPYFAKNNNIFNKKFDYITCTETVEHFYNPKKEFDKFDSLLSKKGLLGIMTGMLKDWNNFNDWHYYRDPTHVVFYSQKTMKWIAKQYSYKCIFPRKNIVIFLKE